MTEKIVDASERYPKGGCGQAEAKEERPSLSREVVYTYEGTYRNDTLERVTVTVRKGEGHGDEVVIRNGVGIYVSMTLAAWRALASQVDE